MSEFSETAMSYATYNETVTELELNVNDIANLAKAAAEIILPRMLWKSAYVNFVGLGNKAQLIASIDVHSESGHESSHLNLLIASSCSRVLPGIRRRRGDKRRVSGRWIRRQRIRAICSTVRVFTLFTFTERCVFAVYLPA